MSRETRQEREKRLAEALRRNLGRRKQARRQDVESGAEDGATERNFPENPENRQDNGD